IRPTRRRAWSERALAQQLKRGENLLRLGWHEVHAAQCRHDELVWRFIFRELRAPRRRRIDQSLVHLGELAGTVAKCFGDSRHCVWWRIIGDEMARQFGSDVSGSSRMIGQITKHRTRLSFSCFRIPLTQHGLRSGLMSILAEDEFSALAGRHRSTIAADGPSG